MTDNACLEMPPDFFEAGLRSPNPIARHYHTQRYGLIHDFLSSKFKKGDRILDIGCGTASWNTGRLPVFGLDMHEGMLKHGKSLGQITESVALDITKVPWPIEHQRFDFAIASEVLEHLERPEKVVSEVQRVLKKGGFFIVTVPLDTDLSLWRILFESKCIVLGDILGSKLWKERCGHVQHFSKGSLMRLLQSGGFEDYRSVTSALSILAIVRKR